MRQSFEPRLVNGVFGDPALYIDVRDERRGLILDLGDVGDLPPRLLMRLERAFVSHAHLDHLVGFDRLLRVVLGRKERIALHGGPGFIDRIEHKLHGYTWNVVQRYEMPLELLVDEVHPSGLRRRARFRSSEGFCREALDEHAWSGEPLHVDERLRVSGAFVDHGIPCLAFLVEETACIRVRRNVLGALGLTTGRWLGEAKRLLREGAPPDTTVVAQRRDRDGEHAQPHRLGELAEVFEPVPGRRIGYVTDLRHTAENLRALEALLAGVDLLYIEAVFSEADAAHAQRKNHLTARQAGEIARRVGAAFVVPFHFSPRYREDAAMIRSEVRDAAGERVRIC